MKNSNENCQYNSCISRGICSINPRVSALQRILILYLKILSQYALTIYKKNEINLKLQDIILNTVAISVLNTEFTEKSYIMSIERFKNEVPEIMKTYDFQYTHAILNLYKKTNEINDAIRFGEKNIFKNLHNIPSETLNLYRIILIITKSLSINMLNYMSFEKNFEKAHLIILQLLNSIDLNTKKTDDLKSIILSATKINGELIHLLHNVQEERYGRQTVSEVSYSTYPSKAVLVVGSQLRELEIILDALRDKPIDVYTHGDMIIAYTYPKFLEYKNLKGQYGHNIESCLNDFATFPGPIILTKNSLHNIDNFYRGFLYTTDYTSPNGIIKIENKDFTQLADATLKSKGFKKGKKCETMKIGFDKENVIERIQVKLADSKYQTVLFLCHSKTSVDENLYFHNIIEKISKNILVISYSDIFHADNIIYANTCFNPNGIMDLYESIQDKNLKFIFVVPDCDSNTVSQILYLSENKNITVLLGKCHPSSINPTLQNTLNIEFGIKTFTTDENLLQEINA